MNERERGGYEELYKQCWEQQTKKDMAANPKLREMTGSYNARNGRKGASYGEKGGRPKLELTEKAKMVDRMLKLNMSIQNISEVLQVSDKSVIQIKSRYNLPREETKEN